MTVRPVTVRRVAGGAADVAHGLESRARSARGHPSLGEAIWRDLARPGPDSVGFVAADDRGPVAYVHLARGDSAVDRNWTAGLVVDPARESVPATTGPVVTDLLARAAGYAADHGDGDVVLWQLGSRPPDDDAATAAGFVPTRELHQLRAPLPPGFRARWPEGVTRRTFRPGEDEAAWLAVNNRAFVDHPEQGGWSAATLQRRMTESWFDPDLFLLAEDAGGVVGFNWLKVHPADGPDPELGEIFVIGVDPRAQGTGLGRALAVAGLDVLAARGLEVAMLYVAADNEAAQHLYRSLGFAPTRVDRAYEHRAGRAGP